MKQTVLKFLFAIIEVVAVIQIAISVLAPALWKGKYSDLPQTIALGGEVAVSQFKGSVSDTSFLVTKTGVEFASIILVVALIGSILCRKRTVTPGQKDQKPRATQ